MLAQLKLELPPLPPLPLDLLLKLFTSSSLPLPPRDAPGSSAKSPPGVSPVGEGGWLGEDTSGGLTPALLTLSRCRKDGLISSAVVFLTGGVPYVIQQVHYNNKKNSTWERDWWLLPHHQQLRSCFRLLPANCVEDVCGKPHGSGIPYWWSALT